MQIDFHFSVTYIVSRLAGLNAGQAYTVAYCAQYVDDATNDGLIQFDNGAMYKRVASAHKMLDYRNFDQLANHRAWLPFHFLPGNGGLTAGENPEGSFIEKLICRPNSPVANDLFAACIQGAHLPYALHLLGIASHAYVDTWAHQGFAGVAHHINRISDIKDHEDQPPLTLLARLKDFFQDHFDDGASQLVGDVLPVGHGAALSHPDLPYLRWSYVDGLGRKIERDNPADFIEAADQLYRMIRRFVLRDPQAEVDGLPAADKENIAGKLRTTELKDAEQRNARWLQAIADGEFSFGPARIAYRPKGDGSWKYHALGTLSAVDRPDEQFAYRPSFLKSDWKLFHDALQWHRYTLLHDILPRYGICAA